MKKSLFLGLIFIVILISGCSEPIIENKTVISERNTIMINHFVFEPQELVVDAGTTVVWKHNDSVTHTIVSEGLFESKALDRGGEFSFAFDKPGEYDYRCDIHPSMRGKIIVK